MTVLRKAMAGAFVLGLLVAQLGLASTARADSSSVDSYIELSATKPASGCTIDGSFEVRSGGYPLAGVEVFIGLYVGTDLISSDAALTDDNGVVTSRSIRARPMARMPGSMSPSTTPTGGEPPPIRALAEPAMTAPSTRTSPARLPAPRAHRAMRRALQAAMGTSPMARSSSPRSGSMCSSGT